MCPNIGFGFPSVSRFVVRLPLTSIRGKAQTTYCVNIESPLSSEITSHAVVVCNVKAQCFRQKPQSLRRLCLQLNNRVADGIEFAPHSIHHDSEIHRSSYPMGTVFFPQESGYDVKINGGKNRTNECFNTGIGRCLRFA
jgi:hypothetical protein